LGGGYFYRTLNKDVKEINKVFLSLFCIGIIVIAIYTSINITKSSYALFSDTIKGEKTIEVEVVNNKPNPPVLDSSMVPVYYDEENGTWNKADETNQSLEYKWYDYDNKMWANSITYDHTKAYNEGNTYEGMTFDGTQYIDASNANYNFENTITAIARFKVTSLGTSQNIISNLESAGSAIYIDANNLISFQFYGNTAKAYKTIKSTTIVEKDTWYTAVGTYDGKTLKLYINGKLEASLSVTDTIKTSTQAIFVGANPNASGNHVSYFTGTISDAIVIKDALSEEEIEEYYSSEINYQPNSNLVFNKKFGNKETYLTEANYTEEGIEFNGTTSYINAGYSNYDLGSKVTVIARFKAGEYNTELQQSILNNLEKSGTSIFIEEISNEIYFEIYGENINEYKEVNSGIKVEPNAWYTVVGTYDGKTLKIYVNGVLENTLSVTDGIKVSSQPYFIGANPSPKGGHIEYFTGTISDAIVINDVISEEEIKTYYSDEVNYNENENTLFYYNLRGYEGRENGSIVPIDMIKTMQVWVPRYKYKVWNYNSDGKQTSEPQEIEIVFEEGTESTGDITCTDTTSGTDGAKSESCKINNIECTDETCNNKYYTHPAFTFGEEELTGFWIGKFELTGTISNITTKPNLSSIRSQSVSSFATNIMKMNASGNGYGLSTNTDTHMIKNMEWGALAYFSHSKYGTCTNGSCQEIGINNNSSYITGCGDKAGSEESTTCNSYETELGQKASTTGNIYGVYDMSGGAYDYVMGNVVSPDGTQMMSGYTTINNSGYTGIIYNEGNYTSYTGSYNYPDTKYYDQYSFGTSANQRQRSKLGDSIKEINNDNYGWYNNYNYIALNNYPWFTKGGAYNSSHAGLFFSYNATGNYAYNLSTRLIINS